ncbi:Ig-like domain-containing protein [Mycolicibacterium iranicum]|uniref:Cadherin domain-containing protein n=1 Tax=Mycolicibacterium iranicum TaxID=912594 RepID=A0A178M3D1_MYCIR|nr:Ig-like domain-containing protein [Mycolicibacterium iranicum]OAN41966.1 hypothetical protein A4X20_03870 [Mycolicibacterium iranicum]
MSSAIHSLFAAITPDDTAESTRHGRYVGRVGALAVALGVGFAIVSGQGAGLARAESDTTASESEASASNAGGDESTSEQKESASTGAAEDDDPANATEQVSSDDSVDDDTAAEPADGDTAVDESGDEPPINGVGDEPVVDESGDEPSVDEIGDEAGDPSPSPDEDTQTDEPSAPTASTGGTAEAASSAVPDVASIEDDDAESAVKSPPVITEDLPAASEPSAESYSAAATPAAPGTPAPAPLVDQPRTPLAAILGGPVQLLRIAAEALDMLFTYEPSAPADPPVLLAVLLFARREIQRTFFNSAPEATADQATTAEDNPVTIEVLNNDVDPNLDAGDVLTITDYTQAAHGTVVLNPDGTFTYTPERNFSGTDTFTYTVSDDASPWHIDGLVSLLSPKVHTATVAITVTAVNDGPTAAGDTASVSEDSGGTTIDVLSNDTDIDGGPLTVTGVTQPARGLVTHTTTGVIYTPAQDFNGVETFTYTITDGRGGTTTATVTVTVTAVKDAPVANPDTATGTEDGPTLTGNVLTNDTDADGDTLTVTNPGTKIGAHGTLTLNADGSYTYTPAANASGTDTFTYVVYDNRGTVNSTATLTITLNAVNDAPVGVADIATGTEDGPTLTGNVLTNDTDADGDTLTVTNPGKTIGNHGTLVLNSDGSFTYTPDENASGTDTFTYQVADTQGGTTTATLTITLNAVNDAPAGVADTATGTEDGPTLTGNVLTNDTDADGDTLTVTNPGTTIGNHGTLVLNSDGSFTYTPDENASGTDIFLYLIVDGRGDRATATLSIFVSPVNDDPVAPTQGIAIDEDSTALAGNLLADASDPDGDRLSTVPLDVTTALGRLVLGDDGRYTYTAAPDANGTETITFSIIDPNGGSATGMLIVSVAAINDSPVLTLSATSATGSAPATFEAIASDVDGDPVALAVTVQPTKGSLVRTGDTFTYTPDPAVFGPRTGTDTFVISASDGSGGIATQTITYNYVPSPTIDLGAPPRNIGSSDDGNLTYALLDSGTVDVFDTSGDVPVRLGRIDVGGPTGSLSMTVSASGTRAFVTNSSTDTVTIIRTDGGAPTAFVMRVPDAPRDVAVNADGTRAVITHGSSVVTIISIDAAGPRTSFVSGIPPGGNVAINAAGTRAFVASPNNGSIVVLDVIETGATVRTFNVGGRLTEIKVSDDGNTAIAYNVASRSAVIVKMNANMHYRFNLPDPSFENGPGFIAISDDGTRAFVTTHPPEASGRFGSLMVFDTASPGMPSMRRIDLPDWPHSVATDANGSKAYVLSHAEGIYEVDVASGSFTLISAVGDSYNSNFDQVTVSDDGSRVVTAGQSRVLTVRTLTPPVI